MKNITKIMLAASLLTVAFAGFAPAQTVVRITGSSAYRAAVTNSILRLLDTSKTIQAVAVGTPGTTNLSNSNQQIIHGFLLNDIKNSSNTITFAKGTEVYFKTSWTGSLSGLFALSNNTNTAQQFLSTSNISTSDATQTVTGPASGGAAPSAVGGKIVSSGTLDAAQIADVAMSDVFSTSTPYSANLTNARTGLSGAAAGGAPAGVVGVVPFLFVAGADAGTSITNINSIQAQQLLFGGAVLSQFTGNNSDTTPVNAVGRDADSGTRFTTFAEIGFDVLGFVNNTPSQYEVTVTGASSTSGGTATSVFSAPDGTINGVDYPNGSSGYGSGSGVAGALAASGTLTVSDTPGLVIGYVGESDAANAVKLGAHALSYNGVSYATVTGTAPTASVSYAAGRALLDQGVYTLWGYEHVYYRSGNAVATIGDALANTIGTTDAIITGELLVNMKVSRSQEGAAISHN